MIKNFKGLLILLLIFIFTHTWFHYPIDSIKRKEEQGYSESILLLYGKLCQIPTYLTQKVLSMSKGRKENKEKREKGKWNILFLILPLTIGMSFLVLGRKKREKERFEQEGGKRERYKPDYSIYLFHLRKCLMQIALSIGGGEGIYLNRDGSISRGMLSSSAFSIYKGGIPVTVTKPVSSFGYLPAGRQTSVVFPTLPLPFNETGIVTVTVRRFREYNG